VGLPLGSTRKVCLHPHNYYYTRAIVIYDRGTLSQVRADAHEKLYIFSRSNCVNSCSVFGIMFAVNIKNVFNN